MRIITAVALAITVNLAGCAEKEAPPPPVPELSSTEKTKQRLEPQLIQAVRGQLKDGEAARFRNTEVLLVGDDNNQLAGGVLCGEVNSKNAFGGYTGFKRFEATYYSTKESFDLRIDGENFADFTRDAHLYACKF